MLRRFRYLIITILFLLPPLAVSISTGPAASEDHIHIEARKTIRVRVTQTFTPTLTRTPTTMPPTVTLTQTAIPTETPAPPTLTLTETLTLAPTQTMTPVSTMTFTPTRTNTPVPPTPTTTKINAVSIAELYQLHTDNKPAFESLYLDQFVQVSGWVSKIDDDRTVEVWNHSNEERVFCRVPQANIETLVPVRPGMHLTVLGKIAVERYIFLGQIIALQDCYVLDYSVPPTPTNTATSTPTDTPTITPTPLPPTITPTPTLSPTITLTPVSALYEVGNTDGDGVYLRESAGGDKRIKAWPDRTVMKVIGPDTLIDGRLWRYVQDPDGNEGYIPVEYLVKHVQPTATPQPTSTTIPQSSTLRCTEATRSYLIGILVPLVPITESTLALGELFQRAERNVALIVDENWKLEVVLYLAVLSEYSQDIVDRGQPADAAARDIHSIVVKAAQSFNDSVPLVAQGVDELDANILERGANKLVAGASYLEAASVRISALCE